MKSLPLLALLASVILLLLVSFHHRDRLHNLTRRYIITKSRRPVVLISMDGFRHDYIETTKARGLALPNFDRMIHEGSRALRSKNVYPTITGPNHYSLITGVFPETHGIVLNYFIDRNLDNRTWSLDSQADNQDSRFVSGRWPEPIWRTAQRHGRRVGNMLWPVTDAQIDGDQPFLAQGQYEFLNDGNTIEDFEKRVNTTLFWLRGGGPEKFAYDLDLVLLYFPEPDETGHGYGPNSIQVAHKIVELDRILGKLLDGLGSDPQVDLILTSDHGMSEMSVDRIIALNDFVPSHWYTVTMWLTVGALYPRPGFEQRLYDALKANASSHMQIFWRHEIPESLHYSKDNGRIAPLILIPDPGWMVTDSHPKSVVRGDHGYNNSFPESQPLFIARGPSFKKNHVVSQVHALDIYPLMCHLADFPPNPHNGSLHRIADLILRDPNSTRILDHLEFFGILSRSSHSSLQNLMILLSCVLILALILSVTVCCCHGVLTQHRGHRTRFHGDLMEPNKSGSRDSKKSLLKNPDLV